MSTKSEVLASLRFREETVTLEGGLSLTLRELTARQRDTYEESLVATDAAGKRTMRLVDVRAALVAPSIQDDAYTVDEIAGWPNSLLQPLFEAALRINSLGRQAAEDVEKNSAAAPGGASASA